MVQGTTDTTGLEALPRSLLTMTTGRVPRWTWPGTVGRAAHQSSIRCTAGRGRFCFRFFMILSPRIKDIWRQKSTAQAIVVPCSAEDSLALGGRNGYNIPAVQSLCCFGRCVACCRRWGAGNTLPLPCYFVFIVIIPLVDRPCNPHRAIARGGKKFQFAWNRQECPRWTFLFFV